MPQAGRSRVLFPTKSLDFKFPSNQILAVGSTQSLTEMRTDSLPGRIAAAGAWD
jgi:hypothetical protein